MIDHFFTEIPAQLLLCLCGGGGVLWHFLFWVGFFRFSMSYFQKDLTDFAEQNVNH